MNEDINLSASLLIFGVVLLLLVLAMTAVEPVLFPEMSTQQQLKAEQEEPCK